MLQVDGMYEGYSNHKISTSQNDQLIHNFNYFYLGSIRFMFRYC